MVDYSTRYSTLADKDKPKAIIFDIDQVLADCDHRLPFITEQSPQDWDSFYDACDKDKAIAQTFEILVNMNMMGICPIFVTGRREAVREKTLKWLQKFSWLEDDGIDKVLFMRKDGDKRQDAIIKREAFEDNIKGKYQVMFVLEDRKSCVEMWRSLGLLCLQNEWGDF